MRKQPQMLLGDQDERASLTGQWKMVLGQQLRIECEWGEKKEAEQEDER
jgi:hypothetical protein